MLWYLGVIRKCLGGTNIPDCVKLIGDDLHKWYKATRCKYRIHSKLIPDRLRPTGEWPKLKAKAAQTRMMVRYALNLIQTYGLNLDSDEGDDTDRLILGCCQLLVEFYDLMDMNSMFLTKNAVDDFHRVGNTFCQLYSRLSSDAFGRDQGLWKCSPKLHWFLHLCLHQICYGNPRCHWTYGDEDLVRIMVGIAESVHPNTIAISVLSKWLWCVFDELLVDHDIDVDA